MNFLHDRPCQSYILTHPPISIMSITVSPEQFKALADCLLDNSGKTPLHERFRALFTLKAVASEEAVETIASGM
jgi:deoxyhypusine monooxygenase